MQPHFAEEKNKVQRGAGTCPDTQLVCIKKEQGGFQPTCSQSGHLPPPTLRPALKSGKQELELVSIKASPLNLMEPGEVHVWDYVLVCSTMSDCL